MKFIFSLFGLLLVITNVFSQPTNLPVTPTIISGKSETLKYLFDGNTETGWFPGWNAADYPAKFSVDFDGTKVIEKIRVFDGFGSPKLTVYSDVNGIKTVYISENLNLWKSWREFIVTIQASKLFIEISDIQGEFPMFEMEFYGKSDGGVTDTIKPPTVISGFKGNAVNSIGLNGFHWVPFSNIPTPQFRMYQMLQWTWTPEGIAVEPTRQADGNYDTFLKTARDKGMNVVFCPNKVPDWFIGSDIVSSDPEWGDRRLHKPNLSGNLPSDYQAVAEYYFQIAARYGKTSHPISALKVNQIPRWTNDPVTKPLSELNLMSHLEVENEPDRPWKDYGKSELETVHKYSPEQYAALLSAAYDGHEGKLGIGIGIKTADPNMKVVMGGLSAIDLNYLARMNTWFKKNRSDKRFCADVINVHHYANSENPYPGNSINLVNGAGVSPEDDHIGNRLKDLMMWVRDNVGEREVWYSEFGWDTSPCGTFLCQAPKPYSNYTRFDLQAMWAVRTYLIGIESGVSVSHIFNAIDENSAAGGYLFSSSGLSNAQYPQNDPSNPIPFAKKRAYSDIEWLISELNGYTYYGNVSSKLDGVTILEFRNGKSSKFFYWSPTSTDKKVPFKIKNKQLIATEKVQSYATNRFTLPFITNGNVKIKAVPNSKL